MQNMPKYAKICQNMPKYAKICQNMPKYAKICRKPYVQNVPVGPYGFPQILAYFQIETVSFKSFIISVIM